MILASLRYHGNLCELHNLLVWDDSLMNTDADTDTDTVKGVNTME